MKWKATRVKRKFVRAMESEVRVGEEKPTMRKIVAEKYMREFWGVVSMEEELGDNRDYLRNRIIVGSLGACKRLSMPFGFLQ